MLPVEEYCSHDTTKRERSVRYCAQVVRPRNRVPRVVGKAVALAVRTNDDALLMRCLDVGACIVIVPSDGAQTDDAFMNERFEIEHVLGRCDPRGFEFVSVAEAWGACASLATLFRTTPVHVPAVQPLFGGDAVLFFL